MGTAIALALSACGGSGKDNADVVDEAWQDAGYREEVCRTMDDANRMAGNDADDMFRRISEENGWPEEGTARLLELIRADC